MEILNDIFRSTCFLATFVGWTTTTSCCDADVVYAAATSSDEIRQLVRIDESTGTGVGVGTINNAAVVGLAFDINTETLYGVDLSDSLVTLNTSTGAKTTIGSLGIDFPNVASLAFDPISNTLFGTDIGSDDLVTINTSTGDATLVGDLGFNIVSGLAFHPTAGPNGVLYGIDADSDQLLTINTSDGSGTSVGSLDEEITSLGFHSPSSTLYGTTSDGELFAISPSPTMLTTTLVGSTGFSSIAGLAAVPEAANPAWLAMLVSGCCWWKRRASFC